ncbi:receptor-interacting serine/threonine-protein kinase 1 isoform 2-T2 [Mantella aurantiaca]
MCRLNHKRVVKLIGVVVEDGNYSLVIEYMTKGNLLSVLKQVEVPVSVKARFILEIIEGMIYLHSQKVIHKDLKPENILSDDDFHIKIADLGVAAFQKWSTLTKEETSRQRSRSGKTSSCKAGTLSYMAPEHLKDINEKATAKSDVYSFGIVIWVIIHNTEPYEHGINDSQLSLCVKDGQRPKVSEDIPPGLNEAAKLMQECWQDDPNKRPSFEDIQQQFSPVYSDEHENNITCDVTSLKKAFPAPAPFIERMASLQIDCNAEAPSMPTRDTPQSLHSIQGMGQGNVNANLFRASNEPEESEEEKHNENLQRKLQEEIHYHQTGSRFNNVTNPSNLEAQSELGSRKVFNIPHDMHLRTPGNFIPRTPEQPAQVVPGYDIYGHGMLSPEAYRPAPNNPEFGLSVEHQRMQSPGLSAGPGASPYKQHEGWQYPVAESGIENLYPQQTNYGYASPINNTREYIATSSNSVFSKGSFAYGGNYVPESYIPDKTVNLTISNSRAIQIGNNNVMSIEEPLAISRHASQNVNYEKYKHVFESNVLLNEQQLQLLRENLSRKWKEFARKVGFREPDIDEIDHDYERDGLKEKVFQVLHKWQMKEGSKNATVGKIAKALKEMGEKDLLNQLIQLNKTV